MAHNEMHANATVFVLYSWLLSSSLLIFPRVCMACIQIEPSERERVRKAHTKSASDYFMHEIYIGQKLYGE